MPKQRVVRHAVTQPSDPSYRLIPLTQGQNAIVDTEDFEWLNQWNWYARWSPKTHSFYAARLVQNNSKRNKNIYMANAILKCKPWEEADHIAHDTLDNRRSNLRKSTHSQNCSNQRIRSDNTSGYKGVTWAPKIKKWRARITYNGKLIHLGYFSTAEEAARAYDEAARKLHGEFATLNFKE